jgi:hypothetical protein
MKLAVATCVAIAFCIGSLAYRHHALHGSPPAPAAAPAPAPLAAPAARKAPRPADKRALAAIDRHLKAKLRKLARRRVAR